MDVRIHGSDRRSGGGDPHARPIFVLDGTATADPSNAWAGVLAREAFNTTHMLCSEKVAMAADR